MNLATFLNLCDTLTIRISCVINLPRCSHNRWCDVGCREQGPFQTSWYNLSTWVLIVSIHIISTPNGSSRRFKPIFSAPATSVHVSIQTALRTDSMRLQSVKAALSRCLLLPNCKYIIQWHSLALTWSSDRFDEFLHFPDWLIRSKRADLLSLTGSS